MVGSYTKNCRQTTFYVLSMALSFRAIVFCPQLLLILEYANYRAHARAIMKSTIIIVLLVLLSACATYKPLVPADYEGETTTIDDTFQAIDTSSANFFYIQLVNGERVPNALSNTDAGSHGRGRVLSPRGATRQVPLNSMTLVLVGQVHHSAPIGYMVSSKENYRVEGEIEFSPKPDEKYVVTGSLSESYSAVWIEDQFGGRASEIIRLSEDEISLVPLSEVVIQSDPLSPEDIFLGINLGESAELVVSKLGKPDEESERSHRMFSRTPPSVTYFYSELGSIRFSAQPSQGQFVSHVLPIVDREAGSGSVAKKLATEGSTLRHVAVSYYRQGDLSVETLDHIARKVWLEKGSNDSFTIDALSWLCKTLQLSSDTRYKAVLGSVANEASSPKLRKYAKQAFESLQGTGAEQFDPAEQ